MAFVFESMFSGGDISLNLYSSLGIVLENQNTDVFKVSAPLRGRALFHFLSLCHLLVLRVVCLGWGGWGGGW